VKKAKRSCLEAIINLMVNSRILIIGANGLIGQAVAREMGSMSSWQGTYYRRPVRGYLYCDITDPDSLDDIFKQVKPACVIHCAQLAGGVDFYEKNPELAKKFHFEGTVNLSRECLKHGAKLIFISSECVFDGKKEFYNETDTPNPVNIYGKYKAESERWISRHLKDYLIIRTMSVFGWDPLTETPNAVMKAYFSITKAQKCIVQAFRWGTPTYVKDLAKAILELSDSSASGIFHIAGKTFINRYEWIRSTCDALGWDTSLLIPQHKNNSGMAFRPVKIGLDTRKFSENFRTRLCTLEEAIKLLKRDISLMHQLESHKV